MSAQQNADTLLEIFAAIERRDAQRVLELCEDDVEFSWPPPLPYGGVSRGLREERPGWIDAWSPLQPTPAERRMDPRVVAATDQEVVILWRQRGVSPAGDRIDQRIRQRECLKEPCLCKLQRALTFAVFAQERPGGPDGSNFLANDLTIYYKKPGEIPRIVNSHRGKLDCQFRVSSTHCHRRCSNPASSSGSRGGDFI